MTRRRRRRRNYNYNKKEETMTVTTNILVYFYSHNKRIPPKTEGERKKDGNSITTTKIPSNINNNRSNTTIKQKRKLHE